jgi:DNA-binding NarL/FixJ family response regulator
MQGNIKKREMGSIRECLIIDDDQDDQEIFLLCLRAVSKEIGFRAMGDCVEAISLLEMETDYTPDCIFIDVNMPKLNGIECLKRIKAIERMQHAKVFMYSTTSDTWVVEESKRLGAREFIVKPSKASELKEILAAIFEVVSQDKAKNEQP